MPVSAERYRSSMTTALRIAAAAEQSDALQKEVLAAEAARHAAAADVEAALDMVDRLRAEAEAKVQATQVWRDAKTARDKAEAIAAEAEKKLRRQLSRRRSEMEQARERFRRTGYDHPQSTFNNNGDIAEVLKGMLEGVVRSGALWDLLQQGHRSRPTRGSIDFGLPDFPLPFPLPGGDTNDATGGAWRNPSSRGGWAPGQPDGSANNDDFSTGGSF